MVRRTTAVGLAVLALCLSGGKCGGGDGSEGDSSVAAVESPDPRCISLPDPFGFPPGFDFVPGDPDLAWVLDFSPPTFVPFRVDGAGPQIASSPPPFVLPFDSDGNGQNESFLAPILDDIAIVEADLALVTASSYEEVIFFSPQTGALRSFEISVPASPFVKADNPLLPDPGSSAPRTALSTFACVRPPAGALDSRGDPIDATLPAAAFCDPAMPSYLSSFTSGAAISLRCKWFAVGD